MCHILKCPERQSQKLRSLRQKKRRKPKKKPDNDKPTVPKKRERKPKGGKILKKNEKINQPQPETKPNIVLHLKCKTSSLNELSNFNKSTLYNPEITNPSESLNIFNNGKLSSLNYKVIESNETSSQKCINHTIPEKSAEIQKKM